MTTAAGAAPVVRRATEPDADAVSRVLAEAFRDYEWTRWTVDSTDHVERIAALQRLAFTELVLPYGEGWVAVDDGRVVSAAMWMRPDRSVPEEVWAAVQPQQAQLEGDRHAASQAAELAMAPFRANEPSYFLGAVGTLPSHQRHGLGRAVLTPVLERNATVACLETCGNANVAFYRGLGFEVVHEVALPDGAPTVWVMSFA